MAQRQSGSSKSGSTTQQQSGGSRGRKSSMDWSERTAHVVGTTTGRAIGIVSVPVTKARRVADKRGGLPVYVGAGALATVGAVSWPIAVGTGAGYAALRKWGQQLPEPLRSLTGSDPELRRSEERKSGDS
jgi:hypothetical protein